MTMRPLITIGILFGLIVYAAVGQERFATRSSTNVSRDTVASIHRALRSRFDANFTNEPLIEVLNKIADEMRIPIWSDVKVLSEEGISTDTRVTLKLHGVTLHKALNLLLEPLLLTFVIEDGVLKVTTETSASEKMTTRVYPVRDLISVQTDNSSDDGQTDYQFLMNAIHSSTPGKWQNIDGEGGQVSSVPNAGSLVIRQTQKVHEQTDGLLTALRRAMQQRRIPSISTDPDDFDESSADNLESRRSRSRNR